jgi:hypothetical protein
MINGKEEGSNGITTEECHRNLNPMPDYAVKYNCEHYHRDSEPHVIYKEYQDWLTQNKGSHPNKPLRFGQRFCNDFNIHDEGLFYEEKLIVSLHIIWINYIIDGKETYHPVWNEDGMLI